MDDEDSLDEDHDFVVPASPDTYSDNGDGVGILDNSHHHHHHHHHHQRRQQREKQWWMEGSDNTDNGSSLLAELQQTGAWQTNDRGAWSENVTPTDRGAWSDNVTHTDREAWSENVTPTDREVRSDKVPPTDRAELKRKNTWLDDDGVGWLTDGATSSNRADLKRSKEAWFSKDSLETEEGEVENSVCDQRTGEANSDYKEAWLDGKTSQEKAGLNTEGEELDLDGAELDLVTADLDAEGAEYEDDVYQQLGQKEQDLMLAAELGKALLEKNQELEQQLSGLSDDFSRKVEIMEQERHTLQSQLTNRTAEYDNTVRDLQDDITQLTEQLRQHDDLTSAGERRHVHDLRQLRQHNEQLSEQLRQSLAQQQALSAEVGQLRQQLTSRRSSLHQRYDHVDELEDELELLRQRYQELEVQIRRVKEERDALATELENLHERLLLLEKQRIHQNEVLHQQHTDILELRDTNANMTSQLQEMTSRLHNSGDSPTLFAELTHHHDRSGSPGNSASVIQFHNGEKMGCLSADMIEDDDFEYDDDIFCDVIKHSSPVQPDLGCHGNTSGNSLQDELFGQWPQPNIVEPPMEKQTDGGGLAAAAASGGTERREGEVVSPSRRHVTLTAELQDLLKEMYSDTDDDDDDDTNAQQEAMACEVDAIVDDDAPDEINKLTQRYFDDMVKAQQNRIEQLERRVQELELQVQELQEERDQLQDAKMGDVTEGHVIQATRIERDKAVEKVKLMEREMARLTEEVVTLNSQLFATIRKKVMISQELDQWQVDLSDALALQVDKRMREYQNAEKSFTVFKRNNLNLNTSSKC